MIAAALLVMLAAAEPNYWLEPAPKDPGEQALQDAAALGRTSGPASGAAAFLAVSAKQPGTAVSGLAQLAAGLLLNEAGRIAEAQAAFDNPDIQKTALLDLRLIGKGVAYEKARDFDSASKSYLEAITAGADGGLVCTTLLRAAESQAVGGHGPQAIALLQKHLVTCPGREPGTLLRMASLLEAAHDVRGAIANYDRLDRDFPTTAQARAAQRRLRVLAPQAPTQPAAERNARDLAKANRLFEGGSMADAMPIYRGLLTRGLPAEELDLVRVRFAETLLALRRPKEAQAPLAAIKAGSSFEAEAAYDLAQVQARPAAYEAVAARFPKSIWGEEALASAAWHYQKDNQDTDALPYYRRIVAEYPDGRKLDQAGWRVAWADYKGGKFDDAATLWEHLARARPAGPYTPACLYWAGRARRAQGNAERARELFEETVRRYKHTYHGLRAREALGPATSNNPSLTSSGPSTPIPDRTAQRVRQLLLIERMGDATQELGRLPMSPVVQATLAWIQWRSGEWRPAIISMKRAYPEYASEAGDWLPNPLWKILYPIQYTDRLQATSQAEGLDPALVAALVWQESTFDASALSKAGARGLMQVMPGTGRMLARRIGVVYRLQDLYDADTGLRMGTSYLHQLIERFGGRVERALAAYNAGPGRVDQWTAGRPDMSAEEFVESIPFKETKGYVMNILAHREHYRRLYGLAPTTANVAAAH